MYQPYPPNPDPKIISDFDFADFDFTDSPTTSIIIKIVNAIHSATDFAIDFATDFATNFTAGFPGVVPPGHNTQVAFPYFVSLIHPLQLACFQFALRDSQFVDFQEVNEAKVEFKASSPASNSVPTF